jgi:hypothetical protein
MHRRFLACLAVLGLTAATAAPGLAATGPGNQKAGIVKAMQALLGPDRSKVTIEGIKITTVPDKVWAIATAAPKPEFEATFQGFYAVLVKVPDRESKLRWVVADFGSAFVGCGVAPVPVMKDLTGERNPCPPAAFG